ncbi:MAG: transketolase [Ignavibacteria bacterium]|nr:transketolase [Ignavibacteria bacterium]
MTYEETLLNIIKSDDRFLIMTSENRASIRNLPDKVGKRFIDTGISEMTQIGMAAGLAKRGKIPITHALSAFLTMRAFEFIRTDIGFPALPVKLVGGFPGLLSEANGATHQALEDISLMRGIPNLNVFCPADDNDLEICLEHILQSPSPYYIRFNNRKAEYEHSKEFKEGQAEIINDVNYVTILTYGTLFTESLKAKELIERTGIKTGLINFRTLKPIDENIIIRSIKQSRLTVIIEDHFSTGGLFTITAETALKNNITGKVLNISFPNRWFKPALFNDILKYEKLTPEDIKKRVLKELSKI